MTNRNANRSRPARRERPTNRRQDDRAWERSSDVESPFAGMMRYLAPAIRMERPMPRTADRATVIFGF